jgi:hypothetical protein
MDTVFLSGKTDDHVDTSRLVNALAFGMLLLKARFDENAADTLYLLAIWGLELYLIKKLVNLSSFAFTVACLA